MAEGSDLSAKKLLIIAPTCDGEDVGEAWVAFQWLSRLANQHDVTLLTYHKRGKTPASRQLPRARVIEWPEPRVFGRFERFNSMLKPGFVPFYVRARLWVSGALKRGESFDLVHQIVPVAMRYPCPTAALSIPFIVGPVGGGLASPPAFRAEEKSSPWYVGLRSIDKFRMRFDPMLRATYTRAACVLGIAGYVSEALPVRMRRFEVMSETAIDRIPPLVERKVDPPVRLLIVGRLVRTKGARDLIRAMALVGDLDVVLDVVGDGPDRSECESLVRSMQLEARVTFHGAQPRAFVEKAYQRADIFAFPSYREPGGNVVFEAMAYGLPLIVVDRGGPGAATDDECAIRLVASGPESLSVEVAQAIRRLAADPGLRRRMGTAARERVKAVGLWDSKVNRMNEIYEDLLSAGRHH